MHTGQAYLEAAREQARAYRYDSALQLIERALPLDSEHAVRHALICLKGELLLDLGEIETSMTVYRKARSQATCPREEADALLGLAENLRVMTDYQGGLELLEQAQPTLSDIGLDDAMSQLEHLRGNLQFSLGQADACRQSHLAALEFAKRRAHLMVKQERLEA